MARVDVLILGRVGVGYGDRMQAPSSSMARAVLAALALAGEEGLSTDRLFAVVWGTRRARSLDSTVTVAVHRLRRWLSEVAGAAVTVRRTARGYALELTGGEVDAARARRLIATAGTAVDPLAEALALWRGPVLADVPAGSRDNAAVAALDHLQVGTAIRYARAAVEAGAARPALEILGPLVDRYDLDEPLMAAWVELLAAAGQQAEALASYDRLRTRLRDELGVAPGPELQQALGRVLRPPTPVAEPELPPDQAVPAALPADVAGFVGRVEELARLDKALAEAGGPVLAAIAGTAGVGKTALAVHWAHRVRDRFPDGQLYLDLRGYDPDQPMPPVDALARLLAGLGVPGPEIPAGRDERAARYAREVAGRRLLILLDNASSPAQVRPLLPTGGTGAVVVTSRDALSGLPRLDLDVLPAADARALLSRLIGARVEAEPAAADALIAQCAALPLALRVAAELAVRHPGAQLAELVEELADEQRRLDLLDGGGDPRAAVRSVLSWSIRHLPADVARTFRLVGLHPGTEVDAYAAAALTGTDPGTAGRALARLARAHLLHPTGPGRYGRHNLLRAYAAELAGADPTAPRAEADLYDWYLAAAHAACTVLYPGDARRRPDPPPTRAALPDLAAPGAARRWLDTELATLVEISAHAPADRVVPLSRVLFRYLDAGHNAEALLVHGRAVEAAGSLDDPTAEGYARANLGVVYMRLGHHPEAGEHLDRAATLFAAAGEDSALIAVEVNLGVLEARQGRYEPAPARFEQALVHTRRAEDRLTEGATLTALGIVEQRLGRYDAAGGHLERALDLARADDEPLRQAQALNTLGEVARAQGRYERAAEHHDAALALHRRMDNPSGEARALDNLGVASTRLGRTGPATAYHEQALALFRRLGERDGEAASLNGLGEAALAERRYPDAVGQHRAALTVARDIGSAEEEARAEYGLGRGHLGRGERAAAWAALRHALAVYRRIGGPEAARVRGALAALATRVPSE